eukprot:scaffold3611_cov105-Alexandrium_tamarense.AAC.2
MMEGVRKCRLASLSHQHLTTKCKGTWTTCYLARLYQPYTELTADQAVTVCQTLNATDPLCYIFFTVNKRKRVGRRVDSYQ